MATAIHQTLTKKTFNNWLKGALAVLFAREGLTEFVQNEISDFQRDVLHSIYIQYGILSGTTCSSCTTANMLKCPTPDFCNRKKPCNVHDPTVNNKTSNINCPRKICHYVKDAILKHHRYHGPTWKITDATRWCSDAFQIAKCYLPPKGYENKNSFDEIDFNGTLGIMISNTRFQNLMTAQLHIAPNVCSKVRDMINENIRHSARYELSDVQLAQCIDVLRDLLQDSKFLLNDPKAKDAVNKLNQLQNNRLTITADDLSKVLEDNIIKCISKEQKEAIQAIKDHLAKVQKVSLESLERIIAAKDSAIDDIKKTGDDQIHKIERIANSSFKLVAVDYSKALKEDLITYYREHESMIPASPLVDEHKVPIEDLYVLPPLWAYNKPLGLARNPRIENETPEKNAHEKQKTTLRQIFRSGYVRYKKIYITASAGFGKTSLSQKLTMTWCQAYSPLTSLTKKYEDKELVAMKYFEYLFLLHLRDYQSETMCNLDDLIMQMLSNNLSRNTLYTKEFLQNLLHEKKCLILLDGLDEWSHPDKCRRTPAVPHNNHPDSCTVLTTSRPWKMGTIGESEHNIDRHIEISELNDETRWLIEENAFRILNERNLNLAGKNIADFDEEVRSVEIGQTIYIPYILLQLMCLFFGGLPIGKSKCEIYSSITEFTLKRSLNKKILPEIHAQSNDITPVPNCLKRNNKCNLYFNTIMKLGKLAFCALFNDKKESSLFFDRKYAKQFMTKVEIEFCLKVGLLCQTKDSRIIAIKRYQVFFQHKSVQEFFSAIYITSEWQHEHVKSTILNVCSSLSGILEMSNVFIFVCGINPDVYTCISGELQKIGDLDGVMRRYTCRTDICSDDDARTIRSYQSMQIQCLQERMRNGNESCPIYLYVVLVSNRYLKIDLNVLKMVIHFNKCNVKSLLISPVDDKITAFMLSLDPGVFKSLKTFSVEQSDDEPVWLAHILTESAHTLEYLTLSASLHHTISLSDISISALTGLTSLQYLYLHGVIMTHTNLKCLYAYISQTTTLIRLKLEMIFCLDHRAQYCNCDATLDLHCLKELEHVELRWMLKSSAAWQTMLLSVGGLPLPVTVEISRCWGAYRQGWKTIVNVIKSATTLSFLNDLYIDSDGAASMTLKKQ